MDSAGWSRIQDGLRDRHEPSLQGVGTVTPTVTFILQVHDCDGL